MKTGWVSIIIPCFNGQRYIRTCVQSLLDQTYEKIEVVFVNDGSTDDSERLLLDSEQKFLKKGYLFKYMKQENQGAAGAVNRALKEIEGEFLMLFDVDDILMPDAAKAKADWLSGHPDYGMVRNNGYFVKEKNLDNTGYLFVRSKREKKNEWIFDDLLSGDTNNWTGSFMVRTELLFQHIREKEIYVSQHGQNLQIMMPVAYFHKTGFIDRPLMKYVNHGASHSRTDSSERIYALMDGYQMNRVEIVGRMELSDKLKDQYTASIAALYHHKRLAYASQIGDRKRAEEEYRALSNSGQVTGSDMGNLLCAKTAWLRILRSGIVFLLGATKAVLQRMEGGVFRNGHS